ncbi:MAG: hypothetical protein Q4D55_09055 [Eubacteriales bacterium]|nr:hypothetical protein [Eubacteriales bacterium]
MSIIQGRFAGGKGTCPGEGERLLEWEKGEEKESGKEHQETEAGSEIIQVGEYKVKISYGDCQETLEDRMKEYVQRLAEAWRN